MTHTVALVGLGRIGWRGFESNGAIPTHGSTLAEMHGHHIQLVAGIDTDADARRQFQQDTHRYVYESLGEALHDRQPSIVVIATPAETHCELVQQAASFASVRGILCEKPMAPTIADCRDMLKACEKRNVTLLIGHQRRYERNHLLAAHFIRSGALGEPIAGSAIFPARGGYLNNGSHAADGLNMLLGGSVPISIRQSDDDTFSLTCICKNGRFTIDSYGKLHIGYMRSMYEDLLECIDTGMEPKCSGDDGMEAVRIALMAQELEDAA
jgi:predicted dehydrogenase